MCGYIANGLEKGKVYRLGFSTCMVLEWIDMDWFGLMECGLTARGKEGFWTLWAILSFLSFYMQLSSSVSRFANCTLIRWIRFSCCSYRE